MKEVYLSLDGREGVTIDRLLTITTTKISGEDKWITSQHAEALNIDTEPSRRAECYLDYMITRGPDILSQLRRVENPSENVLEEIKLLEQFFTQWGPYLDEVVQKP